MAWVIPALASLALHAAPIAIFAFDYSPREVIGIGDDHFEVTLVVAEAEHREAPPDSSAEVPPDPASTAPASSESASVAEQREAVAETVDSIPLLPEPPPVPEPRFADVQQQEATIANAPPPVASTIQRAQVNESYRAKVARHLVRFKRFPAGWQARQQEARVHIRFRIEPDGQVSGLDIMSGSGFRAVDTEALAMVRRAAPFPAHDANEPLEFALPVTYRMR